MSLDKPLIFIELSSVLFVLGGGKSLIINTL